MGGDLRKGFTFGGVTFEEYRGQATDAAGNTARFIAAGEGHAILNLPAFVQPFKVDYPYGAVDNVPMFTIGQPYLWLKFDGLNTANSDSPVLCEFYKVQLDPLKQ